MAKERKTRDIRSLLTKKAPLPTQTEVKEKVAIVVGKEEEIQKIEETPAAEVKKTTPRKRKRVTTPKVVAPIVDEKKERGRPKKDHGRVKFTTIMDPIKRDELKILAIRQGRNVADILDELVEKYLKKHKVI